MLAVASYRDIRADVATVSGTIEGADNLTGASVKVNGAIVPGALCGKDVGGEIRPM